MIDWEDAGKMAYQFVLVTIEWGLKICAVVAGWLALGSKGSFETKLGVGFGSSPQGLRQLFEIPSLINKIGWTAHQYQLMGQSEFQEAYGWTPVNQMMASLNNGTAVLNQISVNLSKAPFTTFGATLIVFISFYLLARIIRFSRQKGQASMVCRWEQKLGDRVFKRDLPNIKEKVNRSGRRSADKGLRQSSPKFT